MSQTRIINTPDQRLRVFVSSTLQELAAERLLHLVYMMGDTSERRCCVGER